MSKRNHYCFGLGTIGRDMFYTLESMFLMTYLTEVRQLSDAMLAAVGGVLTVLRILDAFNDPITGIFIDNTRSRWGKFKPWILCGSIVACFCQLLLFAELPLTGTAYVILFGIAYVLWDISYGVDDIAYWSLLPALSTDQTQREKMGAFSRICANVGMYIIVVGVIPITGAIGEAVGSKPKAWFILAIAVCVMMLGTQLITLIGVKEDRSHYKDEERTTLRDFVHVIFGNDQLLWTTISMILFMIGYSTTTSFGTYFFIYAYGDEGMYSVFAGILGVSQLTALSLFPKFAAKFSRKKLYSIATVLVVVGYIVFFFAPMNMLPIGIAGVLLFVGQAFIQTLMLMFLADTIEYGQWKMGRRNESITFSVQPLINKLGSAIATGVVTVTLIISGINQAADASQVTAQGLMIMKLSMMIFPLIAIVIGYVIYLKKYKIDAKLYSRIIDDLTARGDLK